MKKLLALLLLSVALSANAQDKKNNRPTSYNYMRGVESVQNEKTEEALEFFNKDIQENPKNGYSYSWIAMLRARGEEYGRALTAADMAIKLLPKKDAEYVIFAYSTRADVYLNLEDTVKAISDLTTAIKIKPDENSLYEKRAQIYYEQERYDLADADYQKMIELKPGETMGYMGMGRNANAQKRWDDAIKQFDYVTKLASDYSSGYSFRAESYIGKEKWAEATDDIVKALSLDWDRKALYLANTLKEVIKRVEEGEDLGTLINLTLASYDEAYDKMSDFGASLIKDGDGILTTCFAEHSFFLSLKKAMLDGKRVRVYVPETRPYLQGSRLTLPSLSQMGIEAYLITDGMPAFFMARGDINIYMTASDAIMPDYSVSNKIGTLEHAIAASYYGIPYYPFSLKSSYNSDIKIEMRDEEEVLKVAGRYVTDSSLHALYPAFDIIPPCLIKGIITKDGVLKPFE